MEQGYENQKEENTIRKTLREQQNNPQNTAAFKIQRMWRSAENRKIYKYYRDIILFRCKGNPAKLLKAINPNEAQLLETASNVHLRFRLGGENFPPNIYYKIFIHRGQVDINSFAPRDYSAIKKPNNPHSKNQVKISYDKYKQNQNKHIDEGWYLRIDNNGWRPISHKVLNKADQVELFSANKIKYYHHNKAKRTEKTIKKKRANKLRWLQNLYKNARQDEDDENKTQKMQNSDNQNQEEYIEIPKDYNPLKDDKFLELEEDDFDEQVNELIEWSDNLDYDSYVKDWFQLSTSNASENFVPKAVNIDSTLSSVRLDPHKSQNYSINNNSKSKSYKPLNYITEKNQFEEQD
ncbi:hypothetical protein PPERSA_08866 [Pseudocohnilembus persalinus]|uniref:Uncharacterized protein n=1 Tax=Pseudocohnilembus persalinus TaxID=266149 RepID=A0A0V0R3W2_PSEPJ|nr:hypothetical protein PPERSA_08866 [Pseudocohnilembus persalinus]|eukprot:KRX09150.1 hypothetical protein PPERSA_08866 [Pseudocohnilembus persalinus]